MDEIEDLVGILKSKIEVTASVADRLAYSVVKARKLGLDSLDMKKMKFLSDDEMEVIDAYLFRYGSLVSNIQDGIFKSIGEVGQEAVSSMSNRDKTNLMERLGAIPGAEEFSSIAIIRNKLMHEYPQEMQKHIDRLNFITGEAPRLIELFLGIAKYAERFHIQLQTDHHAHLSKFDADTCKRCNMNPCVCG
jgi:hypothetical protein